MVAGTGAADSAADGAAEVGPRIKTIRLARRMTIEAVAESSGLTKSFLSKVERGLSTPSVAALLRIAAALEIPLANLFENSSTRHVTRAGNYARVEFGGVGLTEFLLTPHAEQRIQVMVSRIAPGGGSGDEPYQLPGDVEFLYVIEGVMELTFPDGMVTLGAGDAITFEPSTPRTFAVPADGPTTTVLWVFSPALSRTEQRNTSAP